MFRVESRDRAPMREHARPGEKQAGAVAVGRQSSGVEQIPQRETDHPDGEQPVRFRGPQNARFTPIATGSM